MFSHRKEEAVRTRKIVIRCTMGWLCALVQVVGAGGCAVETRQDDGVLIGTAEQENAVVPCLDAKSALNRACAQLGGDTNNCDVSNGQVSCVCKAGDEVLTETTATCSGGLDP